MRTLRSICRKGSGAAAGLAALLTLCLAWAPLSKGSQQPPPPPQTEQAEMTSRETSPAYQLKSERNLVMVRIVVRDSKGNARGNLRQEDFHLFDNGKPQAISHFSVETPSATPPKPTTGQPPANSDDVGEEASNAAVPHRYLALFFDDVHLRMEDTMRVKIAALKYVNSAFLPGDLMGVFTSSGRVTLDFTDDPVMVRQTVSKILPQPITSDPESECPEIFDYQAYLIVQEHDTNSIQIASEEYFHCNCEQLGDPTAQAQCRQQGDRSVESYAMRILNVYQTNTQAALRSLDELVRHLAAFPGQRTVMMVSPGFLTPTFETKIDEIVDRAVHANITVNALDAKGLYAPLLGGDDISKDPIITPNRPDLVGQKEQLRINRTIVADEALATLADATGGFFYRNSNDLDTGFQKCGALSEVYYVLAYSPTNLKPDGGFHSIKVKLGQPAGLSLQSRRGYFAQKKSTDPAVQAKEEIRDAIFSPDDLNELPIAVHTQFFRMNETDAKLSVMTHLDLRFVHFQKREGRNFDNLTLVTVLFDGNGKYLTAQEKTVEMRLLDTTLARLSPSGITMKTSFDVKPGTYMVRQVVRDGEGAQISGISRSVQIPF
ncbi:MAG TPA: VWA domain-containing protein [Terriglobia bacterium]|nr:VWA domain-containing protein [Terriglobia bacterium]